MTAFTRRVSPACEWRRAFASGPLLLVCLLLSSPASADIVRLTNGRLMTVETCRFDGATVVLVMRGGGEVRAPRDLVAELLPDEVPFARTVAIEALAASPAALLPQATGPAIRALVDRIAAEVGLDGKLAHAVVRVESNYQPLAVSPKGAMGLMQIMPVIVRQFAVADPFDPVHNLTAGLQHLKGLVARLGLRRGLAAYNAGESAVLRYGGVPPYQETQTYVQKVMAALR